MDALHASRSPNERRQHSDVVCVCVWPTRTIVFASLLLAYALVFVTLGVLQPPRLSTLMGSSIPTSAFEPSRNDPMEIRDVWAPPPSKVSLVNNGGGAATTIADRSKKATTAATEPLTEPVNQSNQVNTSTLPPYAIFYNIFVKPNSQKEPDIAQKGIDIVMEQLNQIAESHAVQSLQLQQPRQEQQQIQTVYYTTVGEPVLNHTSVRLFCSEHNMSCRHLGGHHTTGFEEVTLQHVHEFCQVAEHEAMRVVYLHNKGSYTDSSVNTHWRRHLTMAATSQQCLVAPMQSNTTSNTTTNDACNVCGLQFWPQWSPFFPGNMWAAQCSYVKQLLPPLGFTNVTQRLKDKVFALEAQGKLAISLFPHDRFPPEPDRYMLDRFAAEHWIGSHPSLRPCDLSESADIEDWYNHNRTLADFSYGMAPRKPLRAPLRYWPVMRDVKRHKVAILNDDALRKKEFFLLPGYMFKWFTLYNELPSPSSWVWSWFPDGDYWLERVAKHGIGIIDEMLNQTTV